MQEGGALPVQRLRDALSGSYSIDRELGRGGMATVYLAQDSKHDRVVALKVLHPDLAASLGPDRFLREIKLAARLNHPHILPLFDSGSADGMLYYVMPYVEGESLRERLDRENKIPIDEAIRLTQGIASALDYAHRQGIVHRDVKPENVMLYEGMPMVMDFGIAKAVSAAGSETLTQTGMMVGTPAYVSPEQAAGEINLDGKSDQYSLACILYEMIAGERPFSGATPQSIMAKRFTETPKPLRSIRSTVPASVDWAVEKAMSTESSQRFATSAVFAQALLSGQLTTPTNTDTVPKALVSQAKSVAVLPFANMSADPEFEYFTDGMAEEIINALSKIQGLRVASRTSSFAFKGKNEDIGEIGRKLKVSTVLEGGVRKMGNRLRITCELVNVADGYHLWSERYDREIEDVFAIQDDISQAIVKALRVILSEGEKRAIESKPRTNIQSYDYYLRGRQFIHQLRRRSLEYARQMFNKAIELDPEYALAYTGVADSSSLLYTYFDARDFNLRQADKASRKALELEPDLAEAHVSRGIVASLTHHFEEAEEAFNKAMKLEPKMFEAAYWYGMGLMSEGRFDDALKMFDRASSLRPEDYQSAHFAGQAYKALGNTDKEEEKLRHGLRLMEGSLELNPDDARAANLAAGVYGSLGEAENAIKYGERSLAIDPEDPMLLYNVACMYASLGRTDQAISCLERAVDKGFGHKEWIDNDPDLNSIRNNPKYQSIVDAI
ncbi:MAG TPA: protein kinase [Gemmatimonadaceae bacterium]|nr:protein kinase [Gemmatimonadaceae bacterium]